MSAKPQAPAPSFVHLHLHTQYSLLDGATRIREVIRRAKEFDMPALAITDHGNLFGAVEFYAEALEAGIKPIIGCELYLAPRGRKNKQKGPGKETFHLLVLAMNRTGYQNLLRLSSIGYTEGFYRRPRIDKEVLAEFGEGLICTSTCLGAEIPQMLLGRNRAAADEAAKTYLEIFGPDRFFIELQDHQMPEQRMINPELIDMAKRLGVGVIATNDVHYLDHSDAGAHDALCCINTGSMVADEDRFRFPGDQFYFKSAAEMADLFADCPEAIANTLHVADLCNLDLDLTTRHAPVYRVPDSITDDEGSHLDDAAYLRRLVYQGAEQRYDEINDELRERIDYELEVICSKGFASYFLIVWDCVAYAREHGIPVGARGSGCSAVVAYCLYISAPDPIRYGLYFERFMDPDRDEMPDIDLDICQDGRAELIRYVRDKYGHVAQIITFGTLKARAAIKDVARVMGMGFDEASRLTKLVPTDLKITIDKALAQEPELKRRYDTDEQVAKIIDTARKLEGIARNAGVHAAGIVVADQPLVNFLPLYKAADSDALVTQFDGPTVERVGLLKMDFLGLRTLTTLEHARQLAERSSGQSIDLGTLDLADERVYALFARGDTKGIFQFESGGMTDVIMRMKPNRIEDLIAANALYRPGPMEYIPEYVKRKHGASWVTPHAVMTEILAETYGVMVYQEQVARIVNQLGGIERKRAFRLAKAISKKKTKMIEAMREPFLDGCVANGVARGTADRIFEDILKFGGYAFNKAHSTGYAIVAYQTAWMKTYYPVEFMAALMTCEMGSTDKIAEYRDACQTMGIEVAPPDVNRSNFGFVVEPLGTAGATVNKSNGPEQPAPRGRLRYGLGAIKGVGEKAAAGIVEKRENGDPYKDIFDFCERSDLALLNRGTIEALICAGAFDKTGDMRRAMVEALDRAISLAQSAQADRKAGQMSFFGSGDASDAPAPGLALPRDEWNEAEMLAREKAVLGLYITKHPLANHEPLLRACATAATSDLAQHDDGAEVVLGGMITTMRTVVTKSGRNAGKQIGIAMIEDLKGRVEAILFTKELEQFRALLVPDTIVFLKGSVDRKREQPSLRVSDVIRPDKAAEVFASALLLDVTDQTDIEQLVALLKEHPGKCATYLNVAAPNGWVGQVMCNASMSVACSPTLLHALVSQLGRSSVKVLSINRKALPIPAA